MDVYERFWRPLLFRLPADQAHELGRLAFRRDFPWRVLGRPARFEAAALATRLAGLELASPVGLAAGFDKNADLLAGLSRLGFGYLTVGSITRLRRDGNARPRLARLPEEEAIVNAMGLPNAGLDAAVGRLRRLGPGPIPVVVSVAGFSGQEIVEVAAVVEPYAAAVEIGLICPNTTPEERLEEIDRFDRLLSDLTAKRRKPLFVKLPTYRDRDQREHVLAMLDLCADHGVDAVSVSAGRRLKTAELSVGEGSLTGRPIFPDSLEVVRDVVARAGGRVQVKAAGGVFTGSDAIAMLRAGAATVELYSALIYRGWNVAGHIKRELVAALHEAGLASVAELDGQPAARPRIAL